MSREPGSPIKLAILLPTHEKVDALFAFDLAQMVSLTMSVMPADQGHDLGIIMMTNTYIHQARQELLQNALADGVTHVLWLDSDMRFPPDAFLRLLQREVPFVGINYAKRRMPPKFVGIKKFPRSEDEQGQYLDTLESSEGLEECDILGFGCFLMETATLVNLPDPDDTPWFMHGKTELGAPIGEDAWFCRYMIQDALGGRIFCDHDLSKRCGHLGQFEYKTYQVEAAQTVGE